MLKHSPLISKLLGEKPACFKQAKMLAVYSVGGHFHKVQNFYDAMEESALLSGAALDMCWGDCQRGGTVQNLVFLGNEAEVALRVEALTDPVVKHMPTPASVMVKMLAARFAKLADGIDQENVWALQSNAYLANNPGVGKSARPMLPKLAFEDVADGFKRYAAAFGWGIKATIGDMKNILARSEATPDVVKKAWDILSVRSVMNS